MQTGLGHKPHARGIKVFIFSLLLSVWMRGCSVTASGSNVDESDDAIIHRFCNRCDGGLKMDPCGVKEIPTCQSISVGEECLQCVGYSGDKGSHEEIIYCFYREDDTCYGYDQWCKNSTCMAEDKKDDPICIYKGHLADHYWDEMNRCEDYMEERKTTKAPASSGSEVNVTAIILGWILSLVLLLVVIGAVILYRQRKGNSSGQPTLVSSDVELAAIGSNRAQLPVPPTLGGSVEYSYAYDHLSTNPRAEHHTYDCVDEGEGSSRYCTDVSREASSAERVVVTEDAKETQGQDVNEEDDHVTGEDRRTVDAVVEVTDSSTGVRSTEGTDTTYFTLIPTEERNTKKEDSGYEVAAVTPVDDVTSSSTEVLTQKEDSNTYFPLGPNIDHMSPNEQPDGYEVAGVMQPATNVQGEAVTPICSCLSPKTAGTERTTSYDHLVRDLKKSSHGGALPGKNKTDNYQHLNV